MLIIELAFLNTKNRGAGFLEIKVMGLQFKYEKNIGT